jgi:hypothetical protein
MRSCISFRGRFPEITKAHPSKNRLDKTATEIGAKAEIMAGSASIAVRKYKITVVRSWEFPKDINL